MANPLDRTWFNTLIDDDGSGTTGSIWNKTQIDGLLDTVDGSLAGLVDKGGTPAVNQVAIFNDADTVRGDPKLLYAPSALQLPGAQLWLSDPTGPVDGRNWGLFAAGEKLYVYCLGDTGAGQIAPLTIARDGRIEINRGQLLFPATQNPSGDSYTLDDYREGFNAWAPTLGASGGYSGQVYIGRYGHYTKIGRRVDLSFWIGLSLKGTLTGDIGIYTLPFPADPNSSLGCVGTVLWYGFATPMSNVITFLDIPQQALMLRGTTNPGVTNNTPLSTGNINDDVLLIGSASYIAWA